MLTYELQKAPGVPLYEALYRQIRQDILSGKLAPGEKLPSKRALSENLKVSKITVEGAYNQLLSEGYLRSQEKVGYFVENTERIPARTAIPMPPEPPKEDLIDLVGSGPVHFPFSVWSRLQRQVMLDLGEKLLLPIHSQGIPELRQAIADHLASFRGMAVNPQNILIGAGTDFLYNLLVQLLGREKRYAAEDPGYAKIKDIYRAAGADCADIPLDTMGVDPQKLGDAQVLHFSPSHHFPTGLVTPLSRRKALLQWAKARPGRYLIEDDYDSEFRFAAHPMPAVHSLDRDGTVIYINTFSRSLAPSIRISYMILPDALMEKFRRQFPFYSCTVSSFEQYTLARFLQEGYFEKHINRMRKFYRSQRNRILSLLENAPYAEKLTFHEENAGLHFLLRVETELSDEQLQKLLRKLRIRVSCLSDFYRGPVPASARHTLVVSYSGITDAQFQELKEILDRNGF